MAGSTCPARENSGASRQRHCVPAEPLYGVLSPIGWARALTWINSQGRLTRIVELPVPVRVNCGLWSRGTMLA